MIHITEHALQRLQERGISAPEARRAVRQGRYIEQRGNACRVQSLDLTVVVSIEADGREAVILTAWRA